jgi:hypothetical protein
LSAFLRQQIGKAREFEDIRNRLFPALPCAVTNELAKFLIHACITVTVSELGYPP